MSCSFISGKVHSRVQGRVQSCAVPVALFRIALTPNYKSGMRVDHWAQSLLHSTTGVPGNQISEWLPIWKIWTQAKPCGYHQSIQQWITQSSHWEKKKTAEEMACRYRQAVSTFIFPAQLFYSKCSLLGWSFEKYIYKGLRLCCAISKLCQELQIQPNFGKIRMFGTNRSRFYIFHCGNFLPFEPIVFDKQIKMIWIWLFELHLQRTYTLNLKWFIYLATWRSHQATTSEVIVPTHLATISQIFTLFSFCFLACIYSWGKYVVVKMLSALLCSPVTCWLCPYRWILEHFWVLTAACHGQKQNQNEL